MLAYCLKHKEKTDGKKPTNFQKQNKGRIWSHQTVRFVCSKKSRFIKELETSEIIGSLEKYLNKISPVGFVLF